MGSLNNWRFCRENPKSLSQRTRRDAKEAPRRFLYQEFFLASLGGFSAILARKSEESLAKIAKESQRKRQEDFLYQEFFFASLGGFSAIFARDSEGPLAKNAKGRKGSAKKISISRVLLGESWRFLCDLGERIRRISRKEREGMQRKREEDLFLRYLLSEP